MFPLASLIPTDGERGNDVLLGRFLEYIDGRKLTLYPAQENAVLELFEERNVILNTPTGSGKSLVAAALHFKSLAQGRRSIYTCPIKALVRQGKRKGVSLTPFSALTRIPAECRPIPRI